MDGQTDNLEMQESATEQQEQQVEQTSKPQAQDSESANMQEAFEKYYQNDSKPAEATVDTTTTTEPTSTITESIPAGDGDVPSESTSPVPEIDYGARKKAFINNIGIAAQESARQIFQKNGIEMIKVLDLYEKDERGYVRFNNPDDPNRPFSSREEAQKWCDSFNNTVAIEFKDTVKNEQNRLMQEYQPTLQLYDFVSKYNKFSQQKKELLNELVTPYAIKNKSGEVIGYNCNLDSAAKQADTILKKFGDKASEAPQVKAAQKNKASEPALDISATGASSAKRKPSGSLQEAMENYYQDKERNKNDKR